MVELVYRAAERKDAVLQIELGRLGLCRYDRRGVQTKTPGAHYHESIYYPIKPYDKPTPPCTSCGSTVQEWVWCNITAHHRRYLCDRCFNDLVILEKLGG